MANNKEGSDRTNISTDNIVKPSLDELSVGDRLEIERKKAELEDLLLMRFSKNRQGNIVKCDDLPLVVIQEVRPAEVPRPTSIPVSPEDLTSMFGHYSKVYSDMMDEKISRVLGKLPASSSATTFVPPNTHVSTSSATPSASIS